MKGINLELTEWQRDQLEPLFDLVKIQHNNDEPVALMAQVYESPDTGSKPFMEVRLIESEMCKKVQGALGAEIGKVADSVITILAPV